MSGYPGDSDILSHVDCNNEDFNSPLLPEINVACLDTVPLDSILHYLHGHRFLA
jgi:hypothetical protein